ncbi:MULTISPECIES: GPW/gp25 family protein [unclassified Burkholderia]|uniref:GPW/gp25 family protein n=1 Tax=unclassified Burkholderia TaxID=2613784 RepID=UPI00141FFD40|nr:MULTISPECIES: GPW/gp25 family protein [unclassified Burkholderia]NIE58644.1 GPW/gp25 family protein [Burkholderia sp. Ap-955]NIF10155.1 GPW/gp25 family protein [Burkholderia sp. Ax-1735]NIG03606.1 GPW/gp25 family protein [Burkholderia sp. Tr-849]
MNGGIDDVKAFLGIGWAFPPCLASDGRAALKKYEDDIHEAIRIILGTDRNERMMRPDFGAGLNDFVFEPLNATTMHLVQTRVQEALVAWEPRIDVLDVSVTSDTSTRNQLLIDMTYRVRATNSQYNQVYPFFLQEGSAA